MFTRTSVPSSIVHLIQLVMLRDSFCHSAFGVAPPYIYGAALYLWVGNPPVTPNKKFDYANPPWGSYLRHKRVEERAQDEAWQEIAAERKSAKEAAQAAATERQPKPNGTSQK
jgi:hypothetical protein